MAERDPQQFKQPRRAWPDAVIASALLAAAAAVAPAARADDLCLECHRQAGELELRLPAEQVPQSVHRDPAMSCVGCHGGDPADPTGRAHAAETGFVGRPAPAAVVELCGGCHGDARFVRRFNASLPVDQQLLFKDSRHGELAAAGDGAAPICTTCHRYHDVLPAADPRSTVHPLRVAALCGSCHADAEQMSGFAIPVNQVAEWRRSAHADALAAGTPRPPTCTGCHGSHSGLPAEVASVARVCSSCHEVELEHFQRSGHAEPFRRLGFAPCVPCHGTHDVPAAQPYAIAFGPDGSCSGCHAGDAEIQQTNAALGAELERATRRGVEARRRVELAQAGGLDVEGAANALAELHTAETALAPAVHRFDAQGLAPALADVSAAAERVEQAVGRAERAQRLERGGIWVGLILLGLLLSALLARSVLRARRRRRPT